MRPVWRHDIEYCRRKREPAVLTGMRKICRYMQISPNTFYKLHTDHGLPAMRLPDGRWCTSRTLIDEWIVGRWKAQKAASGQEGGEGMESRGVLAIHGAEGCSEQPQERGGWRIV